MPNFCTHKLQNEVEKFEITGPENAPTILIHLDRTCRIEMELSFSEMESLAAELKYFISKTKQERRRAV
jgi:hypothetical protein